MNPLVDQHVGNCLRHRLLASFLVQAQDGRVNHLGETSAVYEDEGLNYSGNLQDPAQRTWAQMMICLRKHVATAQQPDLNHVRGLNSGVKIPAAKQRGLRVEKCALR